MKALLLCVACLGSWSAQARAQDIWATPEAQPVAPVSPPAALPSAQAAQAEGTPEVDSYQGRVLLGLRQIVLRDFDGAIATLRKAAQREASSPAAFCHLGDAQLEKGDLKEAQAAYESCARFASGKSDARHGSLALVGLCRVVERSQSELRDRREAWLRVRDQATEPATKALAEARLAMYDAALARESAYQAVRRRIVQREVLREGSPAPAPASDPEKGL